jgi:hypothetical protein
MPYAPAASASGSGHDTARQAFARAGPSGVKVRRVGTVHVEDIADFAYDAVGQRLYAADGRSVWTWRVTDQNRKPLKGDASFPSLVSSSSGDAYLYEGSAHQAYKLTEGGAAKVVDGFLGFLSRGAGGTSVLAVENDHTTGTPDAVRRMPAAPIPPDLKDWPAVDQFDTTDVQALAERRPGELVFSSSTFDGSIVARRGNGERKDHVLAHGLGRPGAVAEAAGFVFCADGSGRLYRLSPDDAVHWVSLTDVGFGDAEAARQFTERGLLAVRPNLLWVAAGDGIFELDLTQAKWQQFTSK